MKLRDVFWTTNPPFAAIRSWVIPRLLRLLHSALMGTLKVSTSGVYQLKPYLDNPEKGGLFVLWHDHTLLPLHIFRNCDIVTMMSRSRAGQMQAAFWRLYGWPILWGSTKKKEGIAALRETLRLVSEGGLMGFTPDGPKGPRRQAHGGVVYLASKSGVPVLPLAVAASDAWYLKTWDRYLIPKPFARVHIHMGAPLWIPQEMTRQENDAWRQNVKAALDEAETIAMKAVAMSGK